MRRNVRAEERLKPTILKLSQAIEHRLPAGLAYAVLVFALDAEKDGLDLGMASNATPGATIIAMEKMVKEIREKTEN